MAARALPALTLVEPERAEMVTQPSVRVTAHWTPAHLRMAQNMADSGDLWRLGDLCDQIIGDDRFGELLANLAGSVLGCDLSFEKDERSTAGEARLSKEIAEDWREGWDEAELTLLIMWQQLIGVGFGHHDWWFPAKSGRVVPKFRCWHPKHFSYDHEAGTWKVRMRAPGTSAAMMGPMLPFAKGDGSWIIMTRRGDFRPWSNGLWRGLSRWWLLKQYAISDWGVHSEKGSKMLLLAPDGVGSADRKALASDIFALAKDAVISLPAGFDMKLVEATANTREIYQAQIDAADMAAAIAIFGQNLTTRVDGGSYAASQTHERKENRVLRYVGRKVGDVLCTQSLPFWAEYNFGKRDDAPYPRYETDPPEDKGAKVQTLSELAHALEVLHKAGYTIPNDQIEEEYGIKLEDLSPEDKATVASGAAPGAKQPEPTGGGPEGEGGGGPGEDEPEVPPAGPGGGPTPRGGRGLPPGPARGLRPAQPNGPKPKPRLVRAARAAHGGDDTDSRQLRLWGELDDRDADLDAADGDDSTVPAGMVDGQQYIDRVGAKLHDKTQLELLDFTDRLIEAIDGASSPSAVAEAVLSVYANEKDPERLRELVENAMVMSDLAGRKAVQDDA